MIEQARIHEGVASPDTRQKLTTMRDVLRATHEEPFGLLDTPVQIAAFPTQDSTLYAAHFPERGFYGQKLVDFLYLASPVYEADDPPDRQQRDEILDDWAIENFDLVDDNKDQFNFHREKFGDYWRELLGNHLWQYREAMAALTKEEKAEILLTNAKALRTVSEAINHFPSLLPSGKENVNRWHNYFQIEYRLKAHPLYETIRATYNEQLQNISKARFKTRFVKACRAAHTELFSSLPRNVQEQLIRDKVYFGRGHIDDVALRAPGDSMPCPTGDLSSYERSMPQSYYQQMITREDTDIYRVSIGESFVRFRRADGVNTVIDGVVTDSDDKAIMPGLWWERRNGKTRYMTSDIPPFARDCVDPRANANFGLIVAHILPERRVELPQRILGQDMGEAQLPLLVSMHRNTIMQNGIFDAIEQAIAA